MPEWRPEIRARLAALRLRPERESDIVEELAQHLEERYREACLAGRDEASAAAAAWAELEQADVLGGELGRLEPKAPADLPAPGGAPERTAWPGSWLWADVRHALRTMRRQPVFTATVLIALGVSIGPTTAIASVANWLFWRPLPGVEAPDRLAFVQFAKWKPSGGFSNASVSYANIAELRGQMKSASGFVGVLEHAASLTVGDQPPRTVGVGKVAWDFFDVLGVRLAAGRAFHPEEDTPPLAEHAAIVSEELATATFGSPAAALDKRMLLNRLWVTVVGVAGRGFDGIDITSVVDVWITGASYRYLTRDGSGEDALTRGGGRFSTFVARLAPGADFPQLQAELSALAARLTETRPQENAKFREVTPRVFPRLGLPVLSRHAMKPMLAALFLLGGVLLLLGCANVANMLIARAMRREAELAVRQALGASPSRLVRGELVLAWLLALGGAVLGLGVSVGLKRLIQSGMEFPAEIVLPTDQRVLAATIAAALLTGTLAGLAPAWLLARGRIGSTLARGGAGRTSTRVPRLRSALAAGQLALSLALLVSALLLVATLRNLRGIDFGFDPSDLHVLRMDFDDHGYTSASAVSYQQQLATGLQAAGIHATVADRAPFDHQGMVRLRRAEATPEETIEVNSNEVAHDYFALLRTPLVAGRTFTPRETFVAAPADGMPVIVNETLARRLFGAGPALGRTIHLPPTASRPALDLPIVGVARDSRWRDLVGAAEPLLYLPRGGDDGRVSRAAVIVRSSQPAAAVTAVVRQVAARIDRSVLVTEARPLWVIIGRRMRGERLFALFLPWLSALAFVLAAVGLHGLVSQTSAERTREFGIRLAMGAARTDIARLVARYALTITGLGSLAGLVLAGLGATAARRILFGVGVLEPTVYATAVAVMLVVVIVASAWPAYRATRVEPVDVLRAE